MSADIYHFQGKLLQKYTYIGIHPPYLPVVCAAIKSERSLIIQMTIARPKKGFPFNIPSFSYLNGYFQSRGNSMGERCFL